MHKFIARALYNPQRSESPAMFTMFSPDSFSELNIARDFDALLEPGSGDLLKYQTLDPLRVSKRSKRVRLAIWGLKACIVI